MFDLTLVDHVIAKGLVDGRGSSCQHSYCQLINLALVKSRGASVASEQAL